MQRLPPAVSRRHVLLSGLLGMLAPRRSFLQAASRGSGKRFLELKEALTIPATAVAEPWQSVPFDAWLSTAKGDKLLAGLLLRTGPDDGGATGLDAYCALCPHEICHVEYVRETSDLPMDAGEAPRHPLLVCPCHFSVFDPLAGGRVISGPAHRGLFSFDLDRAGETIRMERVDAGVLAALG